MRLLRLRRWQNANSTGIGPVSNVNGGAIALGHPIGSSGSRVLITLIYELRKRPVVGGVDSQPYLLGGGGAAAMSVEKFSGSAT